MQGNSGLPLTRILKFSASSYRIVIIIKHSLNPLKHVFALSKERKCIISDSYHTFNVTIVSDISFKKGFQI
jgi:hypothetical protein